VEGFVRIGLSATQKPLDEIAKFLVGVDEMGDPNPCEIVDVGARKDLNVHVISPVDNLSEAHYDAIWGSSYDKMISLIRDHETTLVFANSRYKTERTALRLGELSAEDPVLVGAHHGSMSKEVRLDMENRLKQGELDALVATSSLELGIDVGSIDLVCQIRSPKSVSKGMQRIGRAGHLLNATSEGRLLVTDRDDLVESAVVVRAIMDGQIDTTRVPKNCLDVLAQHIVGAVAADDWDAGDLFDLCRQSYCYAELDRDHYDRVLDMLAGNYEFDMDRAPFPKITWDKVNNMLYPERSARLIAFRSSGTIPDIDDYDVYFEKRKTRVGRLDEGFVERLHVGDIFILGSSSWRVLRFQRNRVIVEDVYGRAPTIPYWGGDRDSRTYDLGVLVGQFRRWMQEHISAADPAGWLEREYYVGHDGAHAISEYFWEQHSVTGELPSDKLVLVERFRDELGLLRIVIHSSFGIRVHDPWAMALSEAVAQRYGFLPQTATVDDGILVTVPQDAKADLSDIVDLVTPQNLDELLYRAVLDSPVFASRFRHNAVRSFMVLRQYRDRRTPVWLQGLRASALLDACRDDPDFPLVVETFRECMNESLDVPNLRTALQGLASGEIAVKMIEAKIPSPFTHALLLLGQYGDVGAIPTRERRSRLMHLHRELLKQILDEETLRNLLDADAVREVDTRLQRTHPLRRARNANELARALVDLGDLVLVPDDEISLLDRVLDEAEPLVHELVSTRRAVCVPIPTAEMHPERWIATENLPLYRDAFAVPIQLDDRDRELLDALSRDGPLTVDEVPVRGRLQDRLERLVRTYQVLRVYHDAKVAYVSTDCWVPEHILRQTTSRQDARLALVHKYLRWHGPATKYEIMERYGFPERWIESALETLTERETVVCGEYVPTKALPQWCYKPNLEQIHSLTLQRLRKEMEPALPVEYADFLVRWQHLHPANQLAGMDGLQEVLGQLQGHENFQIVYERDVLPSRVPDYDLAMLDRLCYGGQVYWRRFDYRRMRRGRIGFCFGQDCGWVAPNPNQVEMRLNQWDDDIPETCDAVRAYLGERGACFFDDIVQGTGHDWRLVLRAVWHLVWTGEATNDSYESIRHAWFASGLSACYDLGTKPGRKGVTADFIVRHMLELRNLDPRLGRWAPTERLLPATVEQVDRDEAMLKWAHLLLRRYGIVSREMLKQEAGAPKWRDLRRALIKLELLGKTRRGFFVEGLSGEQHAYPEAIEALREAKLRHPEPNGVAPWGQGTAGDDVQAEEPMVLLNLTDPANPFNGLFPLLSQSGEEIRCQRMPQVYLVLQAGQPLLRYAGQITVLVDLTRARAEQALKALMSLVDRPAPVHAHKEIRVRDWNGHPIDVSSARHLLLRLGFVPVSNRWKGFVYDGISRPDPEAVTEAEGHISDVFEHVGKEEAPVEYNAEWIISRSNKDIRPKVQELIEYLQEALPEECDLVYQPRGFVVRYRGLKSIMPHIQQEQINLHIAHRGWVPPIQIRPDTDLRGAEFVAKFSAQFERTRAAIDAILDKRQR
jgi:ATP-dependent Lhr-like helicase